MYPGHNSLSDKNLRGQPSRADKKNVLMDTGYRETSASIARNDNCYTVRNNGNNYRNFVPNENFVPDEVISENIPNENSDNEQLQLVEKLKSWLNNNFETFTLETIEERAYATKVNMKYRLTF